MDASANVAADVQVGYVAGDQLTNSRTGQFSTWDGPLLGARVEVFFRRLRFGVVARYEHLSFLRRADSHPTADMLQFLGTIGIAFGVGAVEHMVRDWVSAHILLSRPI